MQAMAGHQGAALRYHASQAGALSSVVKVCTTGFALACTLGFQMLLMQALFLGPPELFSTPGFSGGHARSVCPACAHLPRMVECFLKASLQIHVRRILTTARCLAASGSNMQPLFPM